MTLSLSATSISKNVALPHFFAIASAALRPAFAVPRTDEHVKTFRRELSRDFVANAFVRAGNQRRFHVLFIGRVRIAGLQKIL